ncbi:Flp family type IVb pilin [Pseudorhizobium endolithicum]|uniref:Flp family type IVb pilin n=1 Tax=Pseudorhizobium endolithicum TaxID=1191678 RepID=A0ABM8PGY8_9HYPH|nr:Flp family type IVb pilin [Pseudorhizobium endolithicum]CAD7029561.1 Flp family type IVb pilin [Pseudorhizobium endolithicum]
MSKFFARFRKDESGATAIEYGLIAALISVALIAGASTLGNSLDNTFSKVANKMDTHANK